jgi:hypothetical protein
LFGFALEDTIAESAGLVCEVCCTVRGDLSLEIGDFVEASHDCVSEDDSGCGEEPFDVEVAGGELVLHLRLVECELLPISEVLIAESFDAQSALMAPRLDVAVFGQDRERRDVLRQSFRAALESYKLRFERGDARFDRVVRVVGEGAERVNQGVGAEPR